MNTLRGVFPEPKPAYKRNFIQENMRHIKRIQGIYNKVEKQPPSQTLQNSLMNRYAHIPPRVVKHLPQNKLQNNVVPEKVKSLQMTNVNQIVKKGKKPVRIIESVENTAVHSPHDIKSTDMNNRKYRDTGVQTDFSPYNMLKERTPRNQQMSGGDTGGIMNSRHENTIKQMNNLKIDDKLKTDKRDKNVQNRPAELFKGYQRGIVPKYIRDRQRESEPIAAVDPDCPPGHVTIPDAERKETLRALRQSYADLVAELNLLPVKTDTLRTRNRKIELEKQLNKIEEGIKVFSRPKVYVKINS